MICGRVQFRQFVLKARLDVKEVYNQLVGGAIPPCSSGFLILANALLGVRCALQQY